MPVPATAAARCCSFLHADTRLPMARSPGAAGPLGRAPGRVAFECGASRRPARCLRLVAAFACNLRSGGWGGIAPADQPIFLSRTCFDRVGGFLTSRDREDVETLSSVPGSRDPPRRTAMRGRVVHLKARRSGNRLLASGADDPDHCGACDGLACGVPASGVGTV